jgi:hypothetical protein
MSSRVAKTATGLRPIIADTVIEYLLAIMIKVAGKASNHCFQII